MTKLKNPFRLPKRFPNIIKYINRLVVDGTVPPTAVCRLATRDERLYMAETKNGKLYFIGERYSKYLGGCMAGRFNSMIYSFIGLITKLNPSVEDEAEDFLEWVKQADHDYNRDLAEKDLRREASKLGLKVVAAGEGHGDE